MGGSLPTLLGGDEPRGTFMGMLVMGSLVGARCGGMVRPLLALLLQLESWLLLLLARESLRNNDGIPLHCSASVNGSRK